MKVFDKIKQIRYNIFIFKTKGEWLIAVEKTLQEKFLDIINHYPTRILIKDSSGFVKKILKDNEYIYCLRINELKIIGQVLVSSKKLSVATFNKKWEKYIFIDKKTYICSEYHWLSNKSLLVIVPVHDLVLLKKYRFLNSESNKHLQNSAPKIETIHCEVNDFKNINQKDGVSFSVNTLNCFNQAECDYLNTLMSNSDLLDSKQKIAIIITEKE